ncbi:hypothetical protein MAR_025743 [Mya arenaria]|uniref:Uncharacterized protein n=2 Tax=Mya arenaria TaxID=6604 RepID=A0ABY7ENJ4_MYAAR|nr:hypothetical protein MAR_025743 [Mya arenaria]
MGGLEAFPTSINSTSYIEELDSRGRMETLSASTGKAETLSSSSGFNETRSTKTGSEPKLSMSEGIHKALPTRAGPNKICMNVGEAFKFYNGTVNVTITGRPCQNWILNVPHAHEYHGDANFPANESELAAANF